MKINELNHYLTQILQAERFNDYCPNGLQVEGKSEIKKIVTGVTASLDLLEAAIENQADAILVHHGYFWRGEEPSVVGIKKRRIQCLLAHDISLFAYHLPLDAHPEFGNNVMLGKQLDLSITGWLDDKNMVAMSVLKSPIKLSLLAEKIATKLNRLPQVIGDMNGMVSSVAWCTGAAQHYIDKAIAADIDVFISGEISEQTVHAARESNTAYIAAGHHATERYGICALGEHLVLKFGLTHQFIDSDNPV